MTRAKDISKIVTDADLSGTLDVTGTVTAGGLTVDGGTVLNNSGAIGYGGNLVLTLNDTANDYPMLRFTGTSGGLFAVRSEGSNSLRFYEDTGTALKSRMFIEEGGDISFYEDTGTTPKLFWDASAESLGIGTTSPAFSRSGSGLRIDDTTAPIIRLDAGTANVSEIYQSGVNTVIDSRSPSGVIKFSVQDSEKMQITSAGNVGIGTSSPDYNLQVEDTSSNISLALTSSTSGFSRVIFGDSGSATIGAVTYRNSDNSMAFEANGAERMRIPTSDSRSVLSIGSTAVYTGIISTAATNSSLISMNSGGGSEIVLSHHDALSTSGLGNVTFNRGSAQLASIGSACDGATDRGNLKFWTTPSGGSLTERTRIISTGFFKTGNLGGTYRNATGTYHEMITDKSGDGVATFSMTNASYAGGGFQVVAARAATGDTYKLFEGYSGNGGDREFRVDSDGTVHADGAYSSTGGDYAEMFEWSDGNTTNEDRVGKTVVLDGNQIRLSTSSDAQSSIIGVVSARPVILGDAQSERWVGKYETDDFGRYVREEYTQTEWIEEDEDGNKSLKSYQTDLIPSDITVPSDAIVTSTEVDGVTPLTRRRLNSSYDSSQIYIPREQRKEFSSIGLVGKLKVRVGQTVGDRWIKMREISDTVHEYLVR